MQSKTVWVLYRRCDVVRVVQVRGWSLNESRILSTRGAGQMAGVLLRK